MIPQISAVRIAVRIRRGRSFIDQTYRARSHKQPPINYGVPEGPPTKAALFLIDDVLDDDLG
jgi:hypothetical protein